MAGLAVLERTTEKQDSRPQAAQTVSAEEREHLEGMEKCRRVLYEDVDIQDTVLTPEKQTVAPSNTPAPVNYPQRFADYKTYAMPQGKTELFSDVLVADAPAPAATAATVEMPAPAYAPVQAPAAVEEDDALPTRRTMDTLRHTEAETQAQQKTRLFSAVSTRAKVVLAAVVSAIVLCIVLICINTGIINSMDSNLSNLRERAAEEQRLYEEMNQQLTDIEEDFTGPISEKVIEYAQQHGMVRN